MHPSPVGTTLSERALRITILALACGFGVAQVIFAITNWSLVDMDAYWNAALRLRAGEALYPALSDTTAADVYRYAPWFAAWWIPLTLLPKALVAVIWSAGLIGATVAITSAVLRRPTPPTMAVAGILGGLLVLIDSTGNVQAILVAMLLFGVERRSGPIWIALATSLKLVPILFVLVYAGRGEWRRVVYTLAATLILVVPTFLFDLSAYPSDPGELSYSLFNREFPLWVLGAVLASVTTWYAASRRSAHSWLAAAVAGIAALPRLWTYDFTFLAIALARPRSDRQ